MADGRVADGRAVDAWPAYRALIGSRLRSQTSYPASFALDMMGSILIGLTELTEVYVVFHNIRSLGGLTFDGALMVFALSHVAFGLADLVAGQLDNVPLYIRTGTLDTLMLRPLSVLGQMLTSQLTLKRIGQAALGLVVLVLALTRISIDWTPGRVALLVVTPFAGALIFAALFLIAGAMQFWLLDGAELTNSFTYASNYAASFSTKIMMMPLRLFFSFVVPAAFVGYLPTLGLLGLRGPAGFPGWLDWCAAPVAVTIWCLALLAWRVGLRRYAGAGG